MMQPEILQLDGSASNEAANGVAQAMKMVGGAGDAIVVHELNDAKLSVDEKISSTQISRKALAISGDDVSLEKPAHGQNGSCCGSCGG